MDDLKFDKKAIYRLEKEKDVAIGQIAQMADLKEFRMSLIIDLLWAGQLHANPNLTIDQVMEDFEMREIEKYLEPLTEAIEEAFGDIEGDGKKSSPAATDG